MLDIRTKYLGLELKNPIIVGSSGLTKSLDNIIRFEKYGAGAVVLKSLFEEQIKYEISKVHKNSDNLYTYPEADDYIANYARHNSLDEYVNLIKNAKKSVSIPIIASVNCISATEWISFAKKIEDAGADALELNAFILPSDFKRNSEQNEKVYFDIIEEVKKQIKIPIALKIGNYFSSLAQTAQKLSWTGIAGLVIFNRFFSPDIDLDNTKIISTNLYSKPEEIAIPLRWTAILSGNVQCDIAATTGIHDGKGLVKMLLAGAKAVQVCSTLYTNGFQQIEIMEDYLKNWMLKHNYKNIDEFRGAFSHKKSDNPAAFQRVQFMKHQAGIE
ncbi:MAG: dihydroorotate dehydrogenase-like protein [Bacteroidales bacterium]|nr:dihydroorotate dehydrogenase-like protein [Bacteroidales bacterium]